MKSDAGAASYPLLQRLSSTGKQATFPQSQLVCVPPELTCPLSSGLHVSPASPTGVGSPEPAGPWLLPPGSSGQEARPPADIAWETDTQTSPRDTDFQVSEAMHGTAPPHVGAWPAC